MDKYPWQKREAERTVARKVKIKKPGKKVKKKSKKLSIAERIYSILRKDFLLDNPWCQCGRPGCTKNSTEVHHKRGRGRWLNFVEFFLAVCHNCHEWIENHPTEAKELGYSLSRLQK